MLRILNADLRELLKNKLFYLYAAGAFVYPLVLLGVYKIVIHFLNDGSAVYVDDILTAYPTLSIFLVTVMIIALLVPGFKDGTLRNKMMAGVTRSEIVISMMLTATVATVILAGCGFLSTFGIGCLLTKGFSELTLGSALLYYLLTVLSEIAIGVFVVALITVFGGSNLALVVPLVVAFICKVITAIVEDKLFPEQGECVLKGARLTVYTLYSKYSAYAHLMGPTRWGAFEISMGALFLTTVSFIVAIAVFNKRDLA
ncbi:MAG: hypothetical protein K6F84_02445 [Lachnospiraceae bacterium]|nr:hypothetical protein [Lachnospiraceae bacterium]